MSDRMTITRKEILEKINSINPDDYKAVKNFFELNEMLTGATFPYEGLVKPLLPRQYAVSRNAFSKCESHKLNDAWHEIHDFIEASEEETASFLEMQMLCTMLDIWLVAYRNKNNIRENPFV